MRQYSPFFETLYDQPEPVGVIGRGAHYSILRGLTWHEPDLEVRHSAAFLDIALIWDEDHDERIVPVVEQLHRAALLPAAQFIGEKKGGLFIILNPIAHQALMGGGRLDWYRQRVDSVIVPPNGDYWPLMGMGVSGVCDEGLVGDLPERVDMYLGSIDLLWKLGVKPA